MDLSARKVRQLFTEVDFCDGKFFIKPEERRAEMKYEAQRLYIFRKLKKIRYLKFPAEIVTLHLSKGYVVMTKTSKTCSKILEILSTIESKKVSVQISNFAGKWGLYFNIFKINILRISYIKYKRVEISYIKYKGRDIEGGERVAILQMSKMVDYHNRPRIKRLCSSEYISAQKHIFLFVTEFFQISLSSGSSCLRYENMNIYFISNKYNYTFF